MQPTITIEGLQEVQATLGGTYTERNARNAMSTALTRTARQLERDWLGELASAIDRPTSFTLRAVGVTPATGETLEAQLFIRDQAVRLGAPTPAQWLAPQEEGGARFTKKFERALIAQGSMLPGHQVVPGPFATLDGFGNISRGQITQVIAQLGTSWSPGYARTISTNMAKRIASAARRGRQYVAFPRQTGKIEPGVYQREGRDLLPVFLYKRQVRYGQRLELKVIAQQRGPEILRAEATRAVDESVKRKFERASRRGGA